MTNPLATPLDPAADIRWRNWLARGAESDRRTAKRMRILAFAIAIALVAIWLFAA